MLYITWFIHLPVERAGSGNYRVNIYLQRSQLQIETPRFSGIVLNRVGYYTIPSLEDLAEMVDENGECVVENFTVGRKGNDYKPASQNPLIGRPTHFLSLIGCQVTAPSSSLVRLTWRASISMRSSTSDAKRSLSTQMIKTSRLRGRGLTGEWHVSLY